MSDDYEYKDVTGVYDTRSEALRVWRAAETWRDDEGFDTHVRMDLEEVMLSAEDWQRVRDGAVLHIPVQCSEYHVFVTVARNGDGGAGR